MLDLVYITESVSSEIVLTPEQFAVLESLGRSLASSGTWWGEKPSAVTDSDAEEESKEKHSSSVFQLTPSQDGIYKVKALNVVGVVGLPGLELVIQPKIPMAHFTHIAQRAFGEFREADTPAQIAGGSSFWPVIASWCVSAIESLLRRDLLRDYNERIDELRAVRGSVLVLPTSRALLAGRLRVTCIFDEFERDTPPNRVLLKALRTISSDPGLSKDLRRRAQRSAARFEDVGEYRNSDLSVASLPLERRALLYRQPLHLASTIIRSTAIAVMGGDIPGKTFVIPTPAIIETGIRQILKKALQVPVTKERFAAPYLDSPTGKENFNPDLVIGGNRIVGDIKYRVASNAEWSRPELNQVLAFATASSAEQGIVVGFTLQTEHVAPAINVGTSPKIPVHAINWNANHDIHPADSEANLCNALKKLLNNEEPENAL